MTQLGQKVFTYDGRNRMITAVDSSVSPAMQAQYQYDSMGRRISKTVGTSTIRYCYDGAQVIAEYNGSGTLLRRFVYGPGIDEPICMLAYNSEGTETGRYFYHYDGQGNIVGLSDSNGALVEKYNYGVYGLVEVCDGSGNPRTPNQSIYGNPYYFTGRELDNETGLYYYRARMYEPQLGRFLQPDPIGYYDSMNLYQYCGNNPVNFIDPWGLCGEEAEEEWIEILYRANEVCRLEEGGSYFFTSGEQQCAKKAGRIYDELTKYGFKYWEFDVQGGSKFQNLVPGFGYGFNHSFVVAKPTNDNPFRARYLDNFQWFPGLYQMPFPRLKSGSYRDISRRFPYHQGDSLLQ